MFKNSPINLDFPHLKFEKQVIVKHPENPYEGNLYSLDWSKSEDRRYNNLKEHFINKYDDFSNVFPGFASKHIIEMTNNSKFLISPMYFSEIRSNTSEAFNDLVNVNGGFDTMIRDYCYKPMQSHIEVAFYLLADCLFDESKEYFDRKYDLRLVTSMLLWRFWSFKIGRGLLRETCLIDKIENSLENLNPLDSDKKKIEKRKRYERQIDSFDLWLSKVNKLSDYNGFIPNLIRYLRN